MDFVTAGFANEKGVELCFIHVLHEGDPEQVEMHGVVCFEGGHPEVVGDLVAAMHADFVVFLREGLYQILCFVSLCDDLFDELCICEVLPDGFKNPVVSLLAGQKLPKWRNHLNQLSMQFLSLELLAFTDEVFKSLRDYGELFDQSWSDIFLRNIPTAHR